jgi:multisubunit Na+/H+ antiporter MnhB subunit
VLRRDEDEDAPDLPGWRLLAVCAATYVAIVVGAALSGVDGALIALAIAMLAAVALAFRFAQLRKRRGETDRRADRRTRLIAVGALALPVALFLVYGATH